MPMSMMKHSTFVLWSLLDDRIIWTADKLRERFGKAIINNWSFGGDLQFRGFRPLGSSVGSALSQHKFGRAIDINFESATAEEVRQDLKTVGKIGAYKYITACEERTGWNHFDCRFTGMEEVFFFTP